MFSLTSGFEINVKTKTLLDYKYIIEPLKLQDKRFIIVPVNNAEACDVPAGSHWSLLFYQKDNHTFYYLDTLQHINLNSNDKEIYARLSKLICPGLASFVVVDCPQQENTVDCGIYLVLIVEWLLRLIDNSESVAERIIACKKTLQIRKTDLILKHSSLAYLGVNRQNIGLTSTVVKNLMLNNTAVKAESKPVKQVVNKACNTDPMLLE